MSSTKQQPAAGGARAFACVVAFWLAWCVPAPTWAQELDAAAQDARSAALVRAEQVLGRNELLEEDYRELRVELRSSRAEARAFLEGLSGHRQSAARALEELGPAAGDDEPPEPDAIAEQRRAAEARFATIDALARQADLNIATATRLIEQIARDRRERFLSIAMERNAAPFSLGFWLRAIDQTNTAALETVQAARAWWESRGAVGERWSALVGLIAAVVISIGIIAPAWAWVAHRCRRLFGDAPASAEARGVLAGVRTLGRAGSVAIAVFIVSGAANAGGLVTFATAELVRATTLGLIFFGVADAVTRGLFAPYNRGWRIFDLSDRAARRIARLTFALALTGGLSAIGIAWARATTGGAELEAAIAIVAGLVAALIFLTLSSPRIWNQEPGVGGEPMGGDHASPTRPMGRWRTRLASGLIGFFLIGTAASGYAALTRLITERGAILLIAFLVAVAVRASLAGALTRAATPRLTALSAEGSDTLRFWIRAVAGVLVAMAFIPVALLILGLETDDLREWTMRAFLGVQIGAFTLSLLDILVGLALFAAVLAFTRFVQNTLTTRVLPRTRIESGVRSSLVALIGYVGLAIALFVGLSTMGLNLTNLAIVAGALSVGIGFGLQGVVSNFVSGLILLFERPVKVGDWVILASGQGYVRRIGIRATEIETFDRSSIMVPNSELITSPVTNWTHRDMVGRVIVPVGVSYKSDPRQVYEILLKVARDHPETVSNPAPFVHWKDFGDSALIFEVRAYIRDISRNFAVQNDLRFAIWDALHAAGVEIPFPQRDVHIKTDRSPAADMPEPMLAPPTGAT